MREGRKQTKKGPKLANIYKNQMGIFFKMAFNEISIHN